MNVDVNMTAVLAAAVAQFIVGAIWYMPLFGNLWGQIHGFDRHSKKEQQEMQKQMMPLLVVQFVIGLVTAYVLAHVIGAWPDESPYKLTLWMWLGFVLTTQIGAVIFGGTDPKWIVKKILVMAGGAFATLMAGAWVITALS